MLLNRPDNLGEALRGGETTLGQRVNVSAGAEVKVVPPLSDELRGLIKVGYKATYSFLFDGMVEGKPFIANLGRHHRRALKWHWISRHRVARGQKPRYYAYFPILPRGVMKSTMARYIAVVDALISLYYGVPGYCLFFSGTNDKTLDHAVSIEKILHSPKIRQHAPLLSEVMRADDNEKDRLGRKLGWRATFFYTAANYVYHFGSLQSGLAGANIGGVRITQMMPDDIDSRDDSPIIAERNFKLLTTEILPMGASGTLVFWAQNLISRYSCMYRIYKGHARVLTNRMKAIPVPAIRNMMTELRTVDGTVRDIIVGGTATTKVFDIDRCQEELNRMGLPAFLREMQHEVEQSTEGLMIHNYDDAVHVISESEFASKFGQRSMPEAWPKEWGNDWARTKTAKHANVALWRTVSSQNSALPGFSFYFHPMSFPANSEPADVAERVLSCLSEYTDGTRERGGTRLNPRVVREEFERQTWAELRRDELIRANALAHTRTDLERFDFERAILQEVIPQYSEPVLVRNNVIGGVNSHDREDIRLIYNQVYALKCQASNPGKFGGIEQINREFAVDYNEPHPFRSQQKGFTRTFIVVPDDMAVTPVIVETVINGERRAIEVFPPHAFPSELQPDELHDDRLIRYQFMNFRTMAPKLTETGERIDDPLKMDDDFPQLCQMFATAGLLLNTPLSVKEEFKMLVESRVPALSEGEIIIMNKQDQQSVEYARFLAEEQLKEKYGEDVFTEELEESDDSNWWD